MKLPGAALERNGAVLGGQSNFWQALGAAARVVCLPSQRRKGHMMTRPEEILKIEKSFALIGASQDMLKYSYELLFTLLDAGYTVYPINPRYENIEQIRCYASLAPQNAEKTIQSVAAHSISIVWLPPGSWSEEAIAKAQAAGLEVLFNVCPIGTLRRMKEEKPS